MTMSAVPNPIVTDADITALLSVAMSTTSRHRKAAALMLAGAMRRGGTVHDGVEAVASEAGQRYGLKAAAEVHALAAELWLH